MYRYCPQGVGTLLLHLVLPSSIGSSLSPITVSFVVTVYKKYRLNSRMSVRFPITVISKRISKSDRILLNFENINLMEQNQSCTDTARY